MAQITVTDTTSSIVLIYTPNTVVLLSSIGYPGHIVGIRDATGSQEITSKPIVVSTTNGVRFYDGTFSTLIQQPFGSISVSSKSPTTWQILNNVAYLSFLSNAYLSTLTSQYGFVQVLSSQTETISSSVVGRATITNSITLLGEAFIGGDITVSADVDFFSTMTVAQRLSISSGLTVAGNVTSQSTVQILGDLWVDGMMSTINSLYVNDSVTIEKDVFATGALVSKDLSTTQLAATSLSVAGGMQSAGDISTQGFVYIGNDMVSLGSTLIQSTVTVLGNTTIHDNLLVSSNLKTETLSTLGFVGVSSPITVLGSLTVKGNASTFGDIVFASTASIHGSALLYDSVYVTGMSQFQELTVLGNTNISTFHVYSTVQVKGDALSYGTLFTVETNMEGNGELGIGGSLLGSQSFGSFSTGISSLKTLGVGKDLIVGRDLVIGNELSVQGSILGISSLFIQGGVSTTFLESYGDILVLSNISVGKILATSTLGAPIELQISTLSLSNILFVQTTGKVPLLDLHGYPDRIEVGGIAPPVGTDITVQGILNNRSTIEQTLNLQVFKNWYATSSVTSTVTTSSLLSSFVFGPTGTLKPFLTTHGAVLTGSFQNSQNLYYSPNLSTNYALTETQFTVNPFTGATQGGSRVFYSEAQGRWVAVGYGATQQQSILISRNGYSWTAASSGGFPRGGRDVLYGSNKWVAVGYTGGAPATIQYSFDATNWIAATNPFPALTGGADGIAYNGSNLWVAAGLSPSQFGLRYSSDGISWSQAAVVPSLTFAGKAAGYGNGRWVASDGIAQMVTSTDGANWIPIAVVLGKLSFAYNGSLWVAGGPTTGGNGLTSIHTSVNGLLWTPIVSGGFQDRCTNVIWDPTTNLWFATGATNPTSFVVYEYSSDGSNWFLVPDLQILGTGRGIGVGTIEAPDTQRYFIVNLTTIFHSTLSSSVLYASTIQASSIQSISYFGDGRGLSNATSFRSSFFGSSITANSVFSLDVSAERLETSILIVKDSIQIERNTFLSSVNLWVTAGEDSEANGMIQTSFTGLNWSRGVGSTFTQYAKSVTGNSNTNTPFFVATGVDTRPSYTIQWSTDARTWNPAITGGFDQALGGIYTGTSVAYNSNLDIWVAVGINPGTFSTIFYSSDGKNWTAADNGFADSASFVVASPNGFVAVGDSIKFSTDGITWSDSSTPLILDTAAYGNARLGTFDLDVWLGVSSTTIYASADDGLIWSATGNTTLDRMNNLIYGGGQWVGVGGDLIQYSSNAVAWTAVTTVFKPDTDFSVIAYNSNQGRWTAGAVSTIAGENLWSSSNLQEWLPSFEGGFSTSVFSEGVGFGIFTSSLYTLAAGKGAFSRITPVKQAILDIYPNVNGDYITSNALPLEATSNVFLSEVRSIFGVADETYRYVAVGDGEVPQKTIARSITGEGNTWLPAVTGGFSTVGYGITHFNNLWLAVGDAQAPSNVIQYSPDGANWFGTNTAAALRSGGRGIGVGIGALTTKVVAVGKDTGNSTIVYSADGFSWTPGDGSYFTVQGLGIAGGSNGSGPNFVAVGQDVRGSASTILQSSDGISWSNVNTGGFSGAGYGVAYGFLNSLHTYVAVGTDETASKTIQYSTDGGLNFTPAATGSFTQAGYGVAYNPLSNLFFAVGQDFGSLGNTTIKYSGDATNWSNISTGYGFLSEQSFASAFGMFTQEVLITEVSPYLEFSSLIIYERQEPWSYTKPTIRLTSTFDYMAFNETMYINLSTQMVVGFGPPYSSNTVLTVKGSIYTSSFIFDGPIILTDTLAVSSLVVSTLSSIFSMESQYITTPEFAWNTSESKPNLISTYAESIFVASTATNVATNILAINETLFTTADLVGRQQTGIGISTPLYDLDIKGSFGVSSFSTNFFMGFQVVETSILSDVFLKDPYLSMYSGEEGATIVASNLLYASPSSLTMNSILTLQLSTQRVGIYTNNPQYTLDVPSHAILESLSTPHLQTSLLFLTLQSV